MLILLGADAVEKWKPILLVFSGILLFSSIKLLIAKEEEEEADLSNNKVVQFSKSLFDFTDQYDGDKFFTMVCLVAHSTLPRFLLSHPVASAPVRVTRVFACAHVQEHMHCIFAHVHTHSHG